MRSPDKETDLTGLEGVLVTRLDVQDSASIATAVEAAIERFGRIDVLVNNAGYGAFGVLEATPMENVRRQYDVNVIGLIETTKAVVPHFRQNRSGVIVNISSIGGRVTMPLGSLYHGTKFAVEGITESLAYEMGPIGVKMKIVEPGAIKTDFAGRSFDFNNDESLEEYQPTVKTLLGAIGPMMEEGAEPRLVAEVIYQAATDGTDQLRYLAGEDALRMAERRQAVDDATYMQGVKEHFGF